MTKRFKGFSDSDKPRSFHEWQALRHELGRSMYHSETANRLRQRDAVALGEKFYEKEEGSDG